MKKLLAVLVVVISLFCGTVISNAASDPAVILVNPAANSTVYSNNLLISIKLTQPKKIKVSVFKEMQIVNGTMSAVNINAITVTNGTINSANFTPVIVGQSTEYTSTGNLSFYTKQINGLKPGLYQIQIDTIDTSGNQAYTTKSFVVVQEKIEETEADIFETPQSGTMQFLQNLLKTIFGD